MKPGSIYKICGRRYVDSQGMYNIALTNETIQLHDGWRVLVDGGALRCTLVEDRPRLPGQRGAVYELSVEGATTLKPHRTSWLSRGLVQDAGGFETWPGKVACGCAGATSSCGCRRTEGAKP